MTKKATSAKCERDPFRRGWKAGFIYCQSLVRKYRPSGHEKHKDAIECAVDGIMTQIESEMAHADESKRVPRLFAEE
jgi:hypothetical protein